MKKIRHKMIQALTKFRTSVKTQIVAFSSQKYLFLVTLLALPFATFALEIPQLDGRINDTAKLLTPEASIRIEQKLSEFERETSNQIAILTIPTLKGENIDQFSIKVVEKWKLGQKGRDNGVLLILAMSERKVRIEVGMGLQGALPDITASKIIREVMQPYLSKGNFDQGISAGTDAIMAATKGEFKVSPQDTASHPTHKEKTLFSPLLVLILIIAVVCGMVSRFLGSAAGAIGLPLAAYFVFPGLSVMMLFLLAIGGLMGGFLLSILLSAMFGGGFGGNGFGGNYWGGGGFGGGSSEGGDSFSGGGGGFDGGGSSDDF